MNKFKLLLSSALIVLSQLAVAGPLFDAAVANLSALSSDSSIQAAIDAAATESMDLGNVIIALQTRGVANSAILAAINNNINGTSASRYSATNPAVILAKATLGGTSTGAGGGVVLSFNGAGGTGGGSSGTGGATGGVSPK